MKCNACKSPYHEASGHILSTKAVLCGSCAKDLVKWYKRQMSKRSGKVKFYDHAITSNIPK